MKFIFEWKKYFSSERSERVKYFFHEKKNFICSIQNVIFFLLHRYECFGEKKTKMISKSVFILREKQRNEVGDIFTTEWRYGKYVTRIPDVVSYEIYEWRILQ